MRLADVSGLRDNNLNLLRMMAALAVLFGHSFALLRQPEPWGGRWGVTPGTVAVDIFFIISGMLVCGSLVSKQSFSDYLCARILRIFPALAVMLLLTVLVLGPCFTQLSLTAYFLAPETLNYLVKCLSLYNGVAYVLPGVFAHNPYPYAVNGSLWTLPFEIRMYLILLFCWCVLSVLKQSRIKAFRYLLLSIAVFACVMVFFRHFFPPGASLMDSRMAEKMQFERLLFMFFCGASIYVLSDKIVLKHTALYLLLPLLISSVFVSKDLFFALYTLSLAYVVVCLAYLPSGMLRKYNAMGDYSYGVYIYAFPVQQAVAALWPGIMVWQMALLSTLVTLLLAVISWHVIEKPALSLKQVTVAWMRTLPARLNLS